jgi:hypothetical protein
MSEEWAININVPPENRQEIMPRRKCGLGCSQVFEMFVVFLEFEWIPVRYRFSMCIISLFIHIASIIISLIYTSYLKDKELIFLCCFPEAIFILATFLGYINVNKDFVEHIKISLCWTGVLLKLMTVKSIIYIINICSVVTLFFYYSYIHIKYLINRDIQIQPILSDEAISNIRNSLELSYGNVRNNQVATRIQNQILINEYYEKTKILNELEKNKIIYECNIHTGSSATEGNCEECLCCICIESKNNQEVYKFNCTHDIHIECMIEFVSKNKVVDIKCPLCRQNL